MIYILLPIYNEEKNLRPLLTEIRDLFIGLKQEFKIIAVNDGSRDATREILRESAKELPLEIIDFGQNRGVGKVFTEGIKLACVLASSDKDILISLDCDRTHRPDNFIRLMEKIDQGADLVIASRYQEQSTTKGLPLTRAVLSDAVNFLLRITLPVNGARDYSTFFRAYRIGLLRAAEKKFQERFITETGFACMAEILLRISELRPVIAEVPVDLNFQMRQGKSKMKIMRTITGYLGLIRREYSYRFRSLFSKTR